MLGGLGFHAFSDFDAEKGDSTIVQSVKKDEVSDDTIVIWYTDESLKQYISDAALAYRQYSGYDVRMELVPGVDYIENINSASIGKASGTPAPDLYITTHDNLMKAYLAGLATPIDDNEEIVIEDKFPTTALRAVSCDGNLVAYPLYYETNFFLYNKTYMASIAQNRIETEADKQDGQAAQEEADAGNVKEEEKVADNTAENTENTESSSEETTDGLEDGEEMSEDGEPYGDEDSVADQEVLDRLATMIPSRISDITTFANNYDAPEQVESVFKWDVTDIFYNYFFVGNYVEVGGEEGDNTAVFNIYNSQSVECLSAYQNMNQYFTIDTAVDNYDKILQDFIDGKLVFTVATTDAIAKIQKAKNNGDFQFDYGVTTLPDVSSLLKTKGLSVTDAVAINEYSTKQPQANEFASYLVAYKADELYKKTGKISCDKAVSYEDEEINNIFAEYEKSIPLPKMVEAANYWVQLEIAFTKVWKGADPDTTLKELSDTIGAQIEEIRVNLPTQESFSAGAAKYVW